MIAILVFACLSLLVQSLPSFSLTISYRSVYDSCFSVSSLIVRQHSGSVAAGLFPTIDHGNMPSETSAEDGRSEVPVASSSSDGKLDAAHFVNSDSEIVPDRGLSSADNSSSTSPSVLTPSAVPTSTLIKSPSPSLAPRSLRRSHKSAGSVHNRTSAWEHFIFRYRRADQPTPTIFLFVVNFHEPRYSPVKFLSTQFFPLFRNRFLFDFDVVFMGPWEDRHLRVVGNGLPIHGHYSYYSLSLAYHQLCMVEYCHYDSFVFMNDDSYVDPIFLLSYPLDMSLIEPSKAVSLSERWIWYKKKNIKNVPNAVALGNAIEVLKNDPKWSKCQFSKPASKRRGFADFFVISKNDIQDYYEMSSVMIHHYVFLELAAPTINYCLTKKFIDDCNHGRMKNRRTCVHMHPVKYRLEGSETLALNRMLRKNMDAAPPRMY